MRRALCILSLTLLLPLACFLGAQEPRTPAPGDPFASRTQPGQRMPNIHFTDTTGKQTAMADLRGKVVLVNFWATWCGPCQAEIPLLEKEVWEKYRSDRFFLVGIAREQSEEEVASYRAKHGITYPMAADPKRSTYKLFADAGIPRSYLVGPDGTIVYQSVGYAPDEFEKLKKALVEQLAKVGQ